MLPEKIQNISNWDKPGGKLGMVTMALLIGGGLIFLYKVLPYLIVLAQNAIYLGFLLAIIAGILFLISDKKFRRLFAAGYFMLMRKLTGLVVEIDPIAIVEMRIRDMQKKIQDISRVMGELKGIIRRSEEEIKRDKHDMEEALNKADFFIRNGNNPASSIQQRQAVRLKASIEDQLNALENSKMWYEKLSKLEELAKLTVEDTTNEVEIQKKTFERIRKQHKAFKSVMSIMKGDPDELALFTQAMDFMAKDISDRIGEMEHVIDSSGGLLSELDARNGVAALKAEEIFNRYQQSGIDGLFEKFTNQRQIENIPVSKIDFGLLKTQGDPIVLGRKMLDAENNKISKKESLYK